MRIVVASVGRCGSTALCGAIADAFPGEPYAFYRHPSQFPDSGIIKTHCWAPDKLDPDTKYVFIYGDPVMIAISVHERPPEFLILHYKHMGANTELMKNWPTERVLHMRQNFRSWREHFFEPNVFHLVYDNLFDEDWMGSLGEFLEAEMHALARKKRRTVFDPGNPDHIAAKKTYTGLFE